MKLIILLFCLSLFVPGIIAMFCELYQLFRYDFRNTIKAGLGLIIFWIASSVVLGAIAFIIIAIVTGSPGDMDFIRGD
jgi:hypothetical protein